MHSILLYARLQTEENHTIVCILYIVTKCPKEILSLSVYKQNERKRERIKANPSSKSTGQEVRYTPQATFPYQQITLYPP